MRSLVSQGMRDVSISKSELAKKMGVERSWVSKFFREENDLQKFLLGIRFLVSSKKYVRQIALARFGNLFQPKPPLRSIQRATNTSGGGSRTVGNTFWDQCGFHV